jgi:Domain of unknown function (DUF397)
MTPLCSLRGGKQLSWASAYRRVCYAISQFVRTGHPTRAWLLVDLARTFVRRELRRGASMMRSLSDQPVSASDHRRPGVARRRRCAAAASWYRSRASDGANACVEVASTEGQIWVRDSKDPDGPILELRREGWAAFIDGVRYATLGPPALTILMIISGSVTVSEGPMSRWRVGVRKSTRLLRRSDGVHQWWSRKRSPLYFPRSTAGRLAS